MKVFHINKFLIFLTEKWLNLHFGSKLNVNRNESSVGVTSEQTMYPKDFVFWNCSTRSDRIIFCLSISITIANRLSVPVNSI